MPDYSRPSSITLIFGQSSSGKTTFAFSYLLNVRGVACRFIFDDRGQAAARLKLKPCGTARECELALATGWVCFNPHVAFPGERYSGAFPWFCDWTMDCCKRGPGRKIVMIDELWEYSHSRKPVPPKLENIIRTGRTEGLEFLSATHSPKEYHELIRSQATEFVAFNTIEPAQLDSIRPYWPGVVKAADLPKGHYLAFNRDSRGELAGRMF